MNSAAQRLPQDNSELAHVAERMAAAIIERIKQKGECSITHLRALGFSLDDAARYWPEACKIVENDGRRP
ncbi:MAG: hypothetical protein PHX43_00505 [Alphaproteobacteria bacterium]|nr:hypothetical protein [Alphaproteobacteria bacterium]